MKAVLGAVTVKYCWIIYLAKENMRPLPPPPPLPSPLSPHYLDCRRYRRWPSTPSHFSSIKINVAAISPSGDGIAAFVQLLGSALESTKMANVLIRLIVHLLIFIIQGYSMYYNLTYVELVSNKTYGGRFKFLTFLNSVIRFTFWAIIETLWDQFTPM